MGSPTARALLLLHIMAFCVLGHRGAAAFLLRPTKPTRTPTRLRSTTAGAGGNSARDFFIEIPDATLPGAPPRRVHVLDTGTPPNAGLQYPPLMLIGGTAQVINSWVGHTSAFAKDRRFIIYEARGQGRTELDLAGASMATHVEDFEKCVVVGVGFLSWTASIH